MASSSSLPSAHALGRSAPKPVTPTLLPHHFPPPPTTAPPATTSPSPPPGALRPKLLHPSKSSHSLRVPIQEVFAQQLSPIVEQDYLSPEKRPISLPSSSHAGTSPTRTSGSAPMMTPISPATITPTSAVPLSPVMVTARTTPTTPVGPSMHSQWPRARQESLSDSPRPSPVYSTFLSRPLNRSISMSSTRTHRSSASATPPVIPPLDLRPEFHGPFLPTPVSAVPRDLEDVLGSVDDGSSARPDSFMTAPMGRDSQYSARDPESHVEPEPMPRLPEVPEPAHWNGQPRPRAPSRSSSYPPAYPPTNAHEFQPNKSHNYAPSLRSLTSLPSTSSSFIDRRFAESELYLSSHREAAGAREVGKKWSLQRGKTDTACVLFWVGFVAPWCWLIGGWLVTSPSQRGSMGQGGSLLPLFTGKGVQSAETFRSHPYSGYPFVAPSVASLAPPSYRRTVQQPKTLYLKVVSPWIRRCRIAAGVSGIVIIIAFIISFVVVSRT
ncbi:hypothetical protein BJ138DRAFT_438822 [Hygrophoropsis aurantiaca]|uniref:Uncharacterized protein n=1 Tax=Hygrophoropsis aurantiaca TaxID=72124 RepID=A0ACB8A482_9AGAM|nr:hypothetical protein BJ138DRAFT_438822 [Hygrophoropsis aurantiaca]